LDLKKAVSLAENTLNKIENFKKVDKNSYKTILKNASRLGY